MLKITADTAPDVVTYKLEGKVAGPWVDELERTWHLQQDSFRNKQVLVDICEVTFVDAEGMKLLTWMYSQGARFKTLGCMGEGIVEEIVVQCSRSR